MKIAFISQPFEPVVPPVQVGSIAIWTYQVATRLSGACQFVIYSRQETGQEPVERQNDIEYRRVPVGLDEKILKVLKLAERTLGNPWPHRPSFASSAYYLNYIWGIAKDLRRQGCDVVHVHTFSQFVPIIRRFNPNVKIVLHMQSEWLTQLQPSVIEPRLKQADMILGCSCYLTRKIVESFPDLTDRVRTLANGVEPALFASNGRPAFSPANRIRRLLFVGRVSPEKGVHLLLQAFARVRKEFRAVHLDIVGPGGNLPIEFIVLLSDDLRVQALNEFYHGRLRRGDYFTEIQEGLPADVASHVTFAGRVPRSRIAAHYREADVLVNPSLSESFGISLVEAMASGVPVVGTRVGGMTEVIEGSGAGLLVDSGDVEGLTEAILLLLRDEKRRQALGRAGRVAVEACYTWDHIARTLLSFYGRL